MSYPILAPNSSWYKGTTTRDTITIINIVDSYTPTGSETESWNADVDDTGSIKCYITGTELIIAGNSSGKIAANEDASYMFSCKYEGSYDKTLHFRIATEINGLNLFDTSNVTSMNSVFYHCQSLTSLDVSNFDTSNVTDMGSMFSICINLTSLDVSNFDTSNVTNMGGMFSNCQPLTSLDVSNFDTSNVTNMGGMFSNCKSLTSLDVSNFNTSNVTNMGSMFVSCTNLNSLDVSNFDTSNVIDMNNMFASCTNLNSLDVSNFGTSNVTSMQRMFASCTNLTSLDVSNFDTSSVMKMQGMFYDCTNLTSLDVSNFDTSNVTAMNAMFQNCKNLTTLDVGNWDTSNVTNMRAMFSMSESNGYPNGSYLLSDLDITNWNTSSCTDMSCMFYGCTKLKELDFSKWDVSKVTSLGHFAAHAGFKFYGIENWRTPSLTCANALFHTSSATELDLSKWDVSNVEYFCQMFENSSQLKKIKGLENWNTSNGLGFDEMFSGCSALEELDLSSFDTRKAKNGAKAPDNGHKTCTMYRFFNNCTALKKITIGANFSFNGDGTNTNESYRLILPTPSTDYHPAADGYWYDEENNQYSPTGIEDGARTYYSSPFYAYMANMALVKKTTISKIIDSIRAKTGKQEKMKISAVPDAIDGIIGGLGGEKALIEKTFTEYSNDVVINVNDHIFRSCPNLTTLDLPNAESVGYYSISMCPELTSINLPKVKTIGDDCFRATNNLQILDLPLAESIGSSSFSNCTKLDTLILRNNIMCTIGTTPFTSTPIESGTGYIYVPSVLVESYKTADNWSAYANQIRAIEDYPDITDTNIEIINDGNGTVTLANATFVDEGDGVVLMSGATFVNNGDSVTIQ